MPSIDALEIADEPAAWSAAGFEVEDGECRVSRMTLRLTGKGPRRGIVGWTLGEARGDRGRPASRTARCASTTWCCSRPTSTAPSRSSSRRASTCAAGARGPRREGPRARRFFRAGEPILEVVLAPEGSSVARDPDGPARLWGLAFGVDDLERTAQARSATCSAAPRDAVQPGRRIATLRGEAGLGPAIAFMSPGRDALGAARG